MSTNFASAIVMPGANWNSKSRREGSIPSGGANFASARTLGRDDSHLRVMKTRRSGVVDGPATELWAAHTRNLRECV